MSYPRTESWQTIKPIAVDIRWQHDRYIVSINNGDTFTAMPGESLIITWNLHFTKDDNDLHDVENWFTTAPVKLERSRPRWWKLK